MIVPRSLRVSPSIVDGSSTVRFTLAKSGPVSCVVFDAAGNTVARLADEVMGAGEHRLGLYGAGLKPGLYFCKLASGDAGATARLTVVR